MKSKTKQTTTAWRGYGDETEIGRWIRSNKNLPSRSSGSAFAVTNTDLTVHGYMQCVDGLGTRAVQSLIRVEFKSHGKYPDAWQLDTLYKEHAGINRAARGYMVKGAVVVNHGICLCVCSGATPEASEWIKWGRFTPSGAVDWMPISLLELNGLLRFDLHPRTMRRQWLRRHHARDVVIKVSVAPLGFAVEQELINRS